MKTVQASSVGGRNHWWMARCPKHGKQVHLSYLGGACVKCQDEGLVAKGLIKP